MRTGRNPRWRPLVGVLAVGMLAFGLSLQGAPAGDDSAGSADRTKRVRGDTGTVSAARPTAKATATPERQYVLPGVDGQPIRKELPTELSVERPQGPVLMRVKSATGYAASPSARNRAPALTEGDPCTCDADCAGLLDDQGAAIPTNGGCMLAQCMRALEAAGEHNVDGTCQIIQQIPDTRCSTDADGCTQGRCQLDGTCLDDATQPSACEKECQGDGNDDGQNCALQQHCQAPNDCLEKPRVTCVNDGGQANCQVDGGDDQFGRCCDASGVGSYTTQAACPGGSTWLELTDPDDAMHLPVRCPQYSSGIEAGAATNDAGAVYPIVPPPMQCSKFRTDTGGGTTDPAVNFGASCEVDEDCAHRCSGGDGLTICHTNADCGALGEGTCLADTCISALDADVSDPADGGRCDGPYMAGDDYQLDIPDGKALRLQEIRFRGGADYPHEVVYFDFYDNSVWRCVDGVNHGNSCTPWSTNECDEPNGRCVPVRAGSTSVRLPKGGINTWTLERDCDPNCDQGQWCTAQQRQCECAPRRARFGCIADPPFVIPKDGFMVIRAGRNTEAQEGPDDLNGSWVPAVVASGRAVGGNDPDIMWLNDGPIGAADAGPLAAGSRVLAFELVGREIDDPQGACCDPDTGICEDTNLWDCRFCTGAGAEGQARKRCDRNDDTLNWSSIDRECPDEADLCDTNDFQGPRSKPDYDEPWCHGGGNNGFGCLDSVADCGAPDICYGGQKCGAPDNPCSDGTCCQDDGTCVENVGPGDCPTDHCHGLPAQDCATDAACIIGETDFGPCVPRFQGFGTTCDPDCCPEPEDAGGECCQDEYRCSDLFVPCDPLDPNTCDNGANGTCEFVCQGPIIYDIPVPGLVPPDQKTVREYTIDLRNFVDNPGDTCAHGTDFGGYVVFHISECAVITWNYCCSDPQVEVVWQNLWNGCPCSGPTTFRTPNAGRSGYGDGCGNNHCCSDGNYSVEWTAGAGTWRYDLYAGQQCDITGTDCEDDSQCPGGEACKDYRQPIKGRLTIEPCTPAACCGMDCEIDADCPGTGIAPNDQTCVDGRCDPMCSWAPKFVCEDAGGTFLGELFPNPIADCGEPGRASPCDDGACCLPDGTCEDNNGNKINQFDCETLLGDYKGGVRCSDTPCTTCDFQDQAHCQLDTGRFIFPSDRNLGTRRADDFRPQGTPIRRICFNFGFVTQSPPPECADDPPRDNFHYHIYEDALGLPGTELPETVADPNLPVDAGEPIPGFRIWWFSAPTNPPFGVEVNPGDCYWLEITGAGTDCQTNWTHSLDGNNYGVRDDDMSWGYEDVRDNDAVFCIDTGIVVATIPSVDGGCGEIPVACCARDGSCEQSTWRTCSDRGDFSLPHATCGVTPCPIPENDLCHLPEEPVNPDRPPTGAFAICEGDPTHLELGEWLHYPADGPDRLGQCSAFSNPESFGEACSPTAQDCVDPSFADGNICFPYTGGDAYECWAEIDNRLASTDGPTAGGDCFGSGPLSFQADVWYKITAPCRGTALITMCRAPQEYDGMLGVFGDHTPDPRCPGDLDDPNGNIDLITCNDDYCATAASGSGVKWDAREGAVYILRQGGWSSDGTIIDAGQGISQYHVGFLCEPPVAFVAPEPPQGFVHQQTKHRYISVNPTTNAPQVVALQVEITDMRRCSVDSRRACLVDNDCPGICANDFDSVGCTVGTSPPSCGDTPCISSGDCVQHADVGSTWWVQAPDRGSNCPPPGGPPCGEEDWYSRVDGAIYSEDWAAFPTLHIGDCEIQPCITYTVKACDPIEPTICGEPLTVATQVLPWQQPRQFGDLVGPTTPQLEFAPPDGFVGVVDTLGFLLTNQNWGTPNLPQAHPTWIDIHGLGAGLPPNYILGVSDLGMLLKAVANRVPFTSLAETALPSDCP